MRAVFTQRLLLRLAVLTVLTTCLGMLWRSNGNGLTGARTQPATVPILTQTPTVEIKTQPGTPLVISSPRILSMDAQKPEFTYELTNVYLKTIKAYAIKQDLQVGEKRQSEISIHNLDLDDSELLPNQSTTDFDTYPVLSAEPHRITLSVDYVDFSDGTHWGRDIAKSAERINGQRAGARALSKRLKEILDTSKSPAEVMKAIEADTANCASPAFRSDDWKEHFQIGCDSIIARLKRAQKKGGLYQVDSELRQLAERFKEIK
jgi:hypothetical protein